jgi:hypothetical protein
MRIIFAVLCLLCVSFAQTRTIGEVAAKTAEQITVKTDAGEAVNVAITSETKFLRVPPGETSLSKAAAITLQDLQVGDRVLAQPNRVVVMSRSDLQQKHAAEQAEWRKRGTAGKVTSLGPDTITVTDSGGQTVKIATTNTTTFRRYPPDSVRFADAKPSSFGEIKTGDQVRVLGDKSGESINAEVVVSGTFRNFAATVSSVDAAAGEMKLTDLETKKPVTVKVNADSMVRRMPPPMAQMLAARRSGVTPPAAPPAAPPSDATRPRPMGGPRDLGQMLERMPAVTLTELKAGDAVIVASTAGSDSMRATAIAVIAGVEPLLTGPPSDRRLSGPWNFDINIVP